MPYRRQSARKPLGCSAAGIPERQPQSDEHLRQERRRRRLLQPRRWKPSGTRLPRRRLRLLQDLNQTLTALKLSLGHWVQVRSEGSKALQITVGSEVKTQVTCNLLHTLGLSSATNTGNRHTDVNCRTDALVEQVGLQEDLAVSNGNNVGWNERRNVIRLGFNDRQCGQRTCTQIVGELRSTLQQTGVQVEDVTWVSFAARRATQQQGNRTVSFSLLGQVIVDDQDVVALVHPVLTKSSTGERCQPLEACRVRSRSSHDGGVLQSALLFEGLADTSDGGALLTNSDVDTTNLLVLVAGFPVSLLVKDGVDADCGFTSLTVTNDELTLTATDWGHSINSLDAGLHWLFNWLTLQHGRCLQLEDAVLFASDWAQAVNCLTQWVNYAAEELFTHWDGENFASSLNLVAFFEGLVVTKNNNANGVGFKVLCDADYAARELEQLIRHN